MDYTIIGELMGDVIKNALPIGIIITLSERLVQMFLSFAFPKWHKNNQEVFYMTYDYTNHLQTLINNQDFIIENLENVFSILSVLVFMFGCFFVYFIIRKMYLNKQEVL